MNCEKNSVVRRGLASLAVLLASSGFVASSAFAQDECSTAPVLQLNTPTAFSTVNATASAGIPLDVFCPNTSLLWNAASPDIWFKWTAPSDGVATFNTCTADTAAIDTSIALYTGACGTLNQIACNGDMIHNLTGGCNTTDAKVANFAVSGGVTYYVRVAGIDSEFGVARGTGQITVTHSHIAAWGDNSFNQCDIAPNIYNPIKMTVGDSHALAINADGTVRAWGSNSLGQGNVPAGLVSPRDISAGSNFSIAARADGTLVGWGSNTSGRATPPSTVLDAAKVAAGVFHGLALRSNGAVVAWGAGLTNTGLSNNWGQSIIPAAAQSGIAQIAAGNVHSLALTSTGQVIAWGAGTTNTGVSPRFGQSIVPTAAQSDVEKIAAGYHHSVALKRDGTVVCWGAGSLNTGNLPNYGQSIVPAGLGPVMDIAAGRYHTVALLANGVVTAWGLGTDFQTTNPPAPGLAGSIAAGGNVTFSRYVPCVGGTPETYYRDIDGDGFGNPIATIVACTGMPSGYAANALDCNDNFVGYSDLDGDGYGAGSPLSCGGIVSNSDCNDADIAINPAASEICDAGNVDENCNGVADNDDALVLDSGRTSFFIDADNDLYTLSTTDRFCDLPALGYRAAASSPLDCNDAVAAINPGMTELCDASNTDEDCNGLSDNLDAGADAASKSDFYADADNDTFTVASASRFCDLPAGFRAAVSAPIDCNDAVAAINPAATEVCDASNTDENCNNLADNADSGADPTTKSGFYADADNDTYTVARVSMFCDIVAGFLPAASTQIDCNDAVAAINPGATELCDASNVDENCNGLADNNDSGADAASKSDFFADADGDAFTVAAATRFCDIVAGYLASASAQVDCDDSSNAVYPGAVELCATVTVDNNCDSVIDDVDANAADKVDFFGDSDLDSYTTAATSKFCSGTINSGWLETPSASADCDDSSNVVYPGAVELCATTAVDNNCDSVIDDVDANAADKVDFFGDSDLDSYTTAATSKFCSGTINSGWLETPSASADCDDSSNVVYPGAVELCATTAVDNNCDAVIGDVDANAADKVDFFGDSDLDGFTTAATSKFCSGTINAGWLETPSAQPDCDDASNVVYPGAVELCATTAVDNNCDSVVDDVDVNAADKVDFFRDADLDEFTTAETAPFCPNTLQSGWLEDASNDPDCDDSSNSVFPGADELCATSTIDNNCDGVADDVDNNAADKVNFFRDSDLDGFTTTDRSRFCSGTINSGWLELASAQPDCNDLANDVYPGAVELCATTLVDNNCDTVLSDVDANAADKVDFFGDSDLDGFTTAATSKFCPGTINSGWLETPSASADCDDASNAVYPGAVELCATVTVDNNCDSVIDDVDGNAADKVDFFGDSDLDSYTTAATSKFCSGTTNSGWLEVPSAQADCNDGDAGVNPGMAEVCDAADTDENCSGAADDADASVLDSTRSDFWADSDADTYTVAAATRFCDMPAGFLAAASTLVDCNDGDAGVNPGMVEICDAADTDENCSGAADDADASVLDSTRADFWADSDADTYTVAAATRFCDMPAGFLAAASTLVDCNDAVAAINPGMAEICDAADIDENCSGAADDADASVLDSTRSDFWADSDADTYTVAAATRFCDMPTGFLAAASTLVDCNDGDAGVNPGMTELCDPADIDENCNNLADNADVGAADSTKSDFFADADNDSYSVATATRFCDIVPGFVSIVSTSVDCDDSSNLVYPGAVELCATVSVDNNCDGSTNDVDATAADKVPFFRDSDLDGFTTAQASRFCPGTLNSGWLEVPSASADCDDSSNAAFPGAVELCATDSVDNNCDGSATDVDANAADKVDFFRDSDLDGFTTAETAKYCPGSTQSGWLQIASTQADCNDLDGAISPAAAEICDVSNVDENCNGASDDNDVGVDDATRSDFFADADADGTGSGAAERFCDMPAGYSAIGGDTCPSDPLKQAPGTCGCGVVDADANSNGVIDCVEIGVSLQPSLDIVRPGVDFTVSVNSTTPVVPVVGLQVALVFDPAMLEVTGATPSGPFESLLGYQVNNQAGTVLVAVGTLGEPVNTGGSMISVSFRVKAGAPTDCDARERIAFDTSRPVTSRFSRVDGTAFLPVLEPMSAFTVDGAAPSITSVPQDSAQASANCSAVVPDMIGLVVATDDCTSTAGLMVTQSPAAGSSLGLGTHPITFTVTDAAGNAAVLAGSFEVAGTSVDYYDDADLDTYGSALAAAQASCHPVAGKVANNTDCDDSSAAAYPGAVELCATASIDNNCDGNATDVDANAADKVDFFRDGDGDGYTTLETAKFCSGTSNTGYRSAATDPIDCNDADSTVFPGAVENCANAGIDNDCDTIAISDEEAVDSIAYMLDDDQDGFGAGAALMSCSPVSGRVTNADDCDDTSAAVNPAATESCADMGVDNNCNGVANAEAEAVDAGSFCIDADGDGFGFGAVIRACAQPDGHVPNASDCDDTQFLYADTDGDGAGAGPPTACGVSSNNDGCPNNAALFATVTYYVDIDGDGSGNAAASQQSCDSVAPTGYSANSNDLCDSNVHLLAPRTYYTDADGDGFGYVGAASPICETSAPAGFSSDSSDCDDSALLYADADGDGRGAGAPVACGVASNDDGCPNNAALTAVATYYRDIDGDGAGDSADSIQSCDTPAPAGYSSSGGDTCPNDAAKTAPGACGCGVADTDTDSDGLADCVDNCPSVANANQLDCNANGTGDACELADGSAQDCNANGLLDSCDLASGASTDLDGSGAPDDCEYVVGGSGYASIQAAIDAAPNGTTIKVAPGTWSPISVSARALVIQGIGSRDVTFIDGGSTGRAVEISGNAGSRFILRGFTIRNGRAAEGAGMLITDGSPLVENCVFTGNIATGIGGAVRAINSAADFALCSFTANVAASGGAVANSGIAASGATLNFSSCQFRSNTASTDGGAVVNSGRLFMLECTVEQNTAGSLGGGVRQLETGDTTIFTSRFCLNVPDNINGAYTPIGDNILSGDCNANGLCDADEIAAGTQVDCNANGIPDSCDVLGGTSDCNTNGIPDSCDIAAGTSNDIDLNGIPDECKPDCNGNNIPDAYEIATGAAIDCNTNGIPDSCDIAGNAALDCNANAQLDSCEIASGSARDCNSDGVLDSCEIATGAADVDRDGRLDRCEIARGDLDLDGFVNGVDLALILTSWGPAPTGRGDVNFDGIVDGQDLSIVLGSWGAVPNF